MHRSRRRGIFRHQRGVRQLPSYGLLGLFGIVATAGLYLSLAANADRAEATPPPDPVPAGPAAANPLDEPLRLAEAARKNFEKVRDYTCLLVSQERVKGKLLPENLISAKFRTQPFSVYMRWLGPKQSAGQEVCYVAGKNK